MRLDLSAFRYLSSDDFRVLTAIEMGMRNHEIVPVSLIESIAKIKRVNTNKVIANLLKYKLIEHSNLKYDGYSLNYIGYDYLAIHTLMKRGVLMRIGQKLGVGKESDVYICYVNPQAGIGSELSDENLLKLQNQMLIEFMKSNDDESYGEGDINENSNEEDEENSDNDKTSEEIVDTNVNEKNENKESLEEEEKVYIENEENMRFDEELIINDIKCKIAVIKLARLGRTSFRAVKSKRDYVKNKSHYNWLYLSRVSATNEFKYLTGLYNIGFSVPKPYDQNRHAILMDYIPSFPLSRIDDLGDKEQAFNELVSTLVKLATKGLIHGDFNEFNILVHIKTQKIFFIDFPQMISLEHEEAKKYFDRDISCLNKFFYKKFGITFDNNVINFNEIVREEYLDISLKAYGYLNVISRLKKEDLEIKNNKKLKELLELENEQDIEEDISLGEDFEKDGNNEEKIKKEKSNKKKTNKINQDIFAEDYDEELHFDHNEFKNLQIENREKIDIKLSKDDIREKVKRALIKQMKNTGVKGKSNRFKGKKNTDNIKD